MSFATILVQVSRPLLFSPRFDVAHLLHIPPESELLDKVLSELPSDDSWDESNLLEKGYKAANLKRYSFHKIGTIMKQSTDHRYKEAIVSNSDSKCASSCFNETPVQPKKPAIKLENPAYSDLQNKLRTLKAAKGDQLCLGARALGTCFFLELLARRTLGETVRGLGGSARSAGVAQQRRPAH